MGRYVGVFSDLHGDYSKLEQLISRAPIGTTIIGAGDLYAPKDRTYTQHVKSEVIGRSGRFDETEYFKGMYEGLRQRTPLARKYASDAYAETNKLVDVIQEYSHKVETIIIPGNGEVYGDPILKASGIGIDTPAEIFRKRLANYTEKPFVMFYKNGQRADGETNVDTAIVVLPFVMYKELDEKIAKATGSKSSHDDMQKAAIYELIRDDGIVDQVRAANPKYIIQVQHENPSGENFRRFGNTRSPENRALYEAAIRELGKLRDMKGSRLSKKWPHIVIYGHIDRGGHFYQKISVDGTEVDTLHIDEGNELVLIDTVTGEIIEDNRMPQSDLETLIGIASEEGLESIAESGTESASE